MNARQRAAIDAATRAWEYAQLRRAWVAFIEVWGPVVEVWAKAARDIHAALVTLGLIDPEPQLPVVKR